MYETAAALGFCATTAMCEDPEKAEWLPQGPLRLSGTMRRHKQYCRDRQLLTNAFTGRV